MSKKSNSNIVPKPLNEVLTDAITNENSITALDSPTMEIVTHYLLKFSDGKVDKYGIPKIMDWSSAEDRIYNSEKVRAEIRQVVRNVIDTGDEFKDANLSDEEIQKVEDYTMEVVIPEMVKMMAEMVGGKFQENIRGTKDMYENAELKSEVQYHYNTLQECSADYVLKAENGEYKTHREAWRDAVRRGITTNDKLGRKKKIGKMMDLERALGKIKDNNEYEKYGLEEVFPDKI